MSRKHSETNQGESEGEPGRRRRYQIRVLGHLDESWTDWFGGLAIETQKSEANTPISWLTGTFVDQAVLRGVLNKIWDLNLTLLSVESVSMSSDDEPVMKPG